MHIIEPNGTKRWFLNGSPHRKNGPAVIHINGGQRWYFNGRLHRIGGPAIEDEGKKYWFIDGVEYTEFDYNIIMRKIKFDVLDITN